MDWRKAGRGAFLALALLAATHGPAEAIPSLRAVDSSKQFGQAAVTQPVGVSRQAGPERVERRNGTPDIDGRQVQPALVSELLDNLIQAERNTDEKVATLIQILILCSLAITAVVALAGAIVGPWLMRDLRDRIEQRAIRQLKERFQDIQAMIQEANAQFVSALEEFCSHQLQIKLAQFRQHEIADAPSIETILQAVIELNIQPARLRDNVLAIAYRYDPEPRQIQRIQSLWAEVKADNIDPHAARRLVNALIDIVEEKQDTPSILRALRQFKNQLDELSANRVPLPHEPGF